MWLYRKSFSVDPYQTDFFPNPSGKALVKMQVTSAALVSLNNRPASSYSCSHAGGEVNRNTKRTQNSWLIGLNTVFLAWSHACLVHKENSLFYL